MSRGEGGQPDLPFAGAVGRQLALPLDSGTDDSELIVTAANDAAVRLLSDADGWGSPALLLTGPRKSGRSLHARLAAARTGARVIDRAHAADEGWLFDAWNDAAATARPLILIADEAPPAWAVRLPDLRSRLAASPVARLADPDDAMADALLDKLLLRRGVTSSATLRRAALTGLDRTHLAIWRFSEAVEAGVALKRERIARVSSGRLAA